MAQTVRIPDVLPAAAGDRSTASMAALFELVLGTRLTFADRLDPEVLARATRSVLDAEPVLGCHFRDRSCREWQRCENLDAIVPFSIADSSDPATDAASFHDEPFGEREPRLAVRLLRSADRDDLVIRLDHRVGDGWSAKHITYVLADAYSRLLADPGYRPEPDLTPRPGHVDLWAALSPAQREAGANPPRPAAARWRKPLSAGRGTGLEVRTSTIAPAELSAIRAYGSDRGATINDMLVTALLRALVRMFPPGKDNRLGISISADLRRFTDDPKFERICTLANPQTIGVPYDASDAFDALLSKVATETQRQKAMLWGARMYANPEIPLGYYLARAIWRVYVAMFAPMKVIPPVVMNIGVLDESRLRFGEAVPVGAYVQGSFGQVPTLGFTISTYRDALTVWVGARRQDVDPAINDRVLAGMRDELSVATAPAG